MPSSPSLKPLQSSLPFSPPPPPPPRPMFQVSSIYILHGFISKLQHLWRPELDTVACIHRVKQTIVHMILSRFVHQNTYGDVIKAFCKKTSLQRTPLNNGHYCSSQWCPLFGGSTVLAQWQIFLSYQMLYTSGVISLAAAVVVAPFQPYKIRYHNAIDSALMVLMGVYYVSLHVSLDSIKQVDLVKVAEGLSVTLLIFYFLLLLMWKLFYSKLKLLFNKCKSTVCNHGDQTNEGSTEPFHHGLRDYGASDTYIHSPLLPAPDTPTY